MQYRNATTKTLAPAIKSCQYLPESLEALATRHGKRVRRLGRYPGFTLSTAVCHGGSSPDKLAVFEVAPGRLAFRCWTRGCEQSAIRVALGLPERPEPENPLTPAPVTPSPWLSFTEIAAIIAQNGPSRENAGAQRADSSVFFGGGWCSESPETEITPWAGPRPPEEAISYLAGIDRPQGGTVLYHHPDGRTGRHRRSQGKRVRNPGLSGAGWYPVVFSPDGDRPEVAALVITEGEKDACAAARAGLYAACAPGGAANLSLATWQPVLEWAALMRLPPVFSQDYDQPGLKARAAFQVAAQVAGFGQVPVVSLVGVAAGESATDWPDLPRRVASALEPPSPGIGPRPPRPLRLHCTNPGYRQHYAADGTPRVKALPCGKCRNCEDWEAQLHIQRIAKGRPAQVVLYAGFGTGDNTLSENLCAEDGRNFRRRFRERHRKRLEKNSAFQHGGSAEGSPVPKSGIFARDGTATAISLDPDTYRGRFAVFLQTPLEDGELALERRAAAREGLTLTVLNHPDAVDVAALAPPALSAHVEDGPNVNLWTSSGAWPDWERRPDAYDLDDGEELPYLEAAAPGSVRRWVGEYREHAHQTAEEKARRLEEHAEARAWTWLEWVAVDPEQLKEVATLDNQGDGVAAAAAARAIPGYAGPSALIRDAAAWWYGRGQWRRAFNAVAAAAGLPLEPDRPEPPDSTEPEEAV